MFDEGTEQSAVDGPNRESRIGSEMGECRHNVRFRITKARWKAMSVRLWSAWIAVSARA
jgi:hypothetical protein